MRAMRRILSPRWILVHVLVIALVLVMVNLGFWQLRRLDDKRRFNDALVEATARPVTELVRTPSWKDTDAPVEEWRRVVVTGRYDPDHAVTIINRSQDGVAGFDTLVPLVLADSRVLFVNRGFVPLSAAVPVPPDGDVTVMGHVRASQERGTLGAIDSSDTAAVEFHRFDIGLIARRINAPTFDWFLQRVKEVPTQEAPWPAVVPLPDVDEGPHFSYAIQWFFFSATAMAAWVLVVRRRLREPVSGSSTPS